MGVGYPVIYNPSSLMEDHKNVKPHRGSLLMFSNALYDTVPLTSYSLAGTLMRVAFC